MQLSKKTIIATFQGIGFGDATGVGVEFKSRFWMPEHVHFDKFVNVWKGGQNNISPGTYSDDTEHSIGLIEALLSDEHFTAELLLKKWKAEYENDKAKKGFPRDGHGSIEAWYKGEKTIEAVRAEQAKRIDPGNGPVMRAVPLAFVNGDQLHDYCIINADSTHPHPLAREATLITALTGRHFLRDGNSANQLMDFLLAYFHNSFETKKLLEMIDALPAPEGLTEADYILLHGEQPIPWISWDPNIYGLPCAVMKTALNAVYILKHCTNAFDALKTSILMGGDVDSLAAICTGIAAGAYGLESLPQDLLLQTEGFDRMAELGERMYEKFFVSQAV